MWGRVSRDLEDRTYQRDYGEWEGAGFGPDIANAWLSRGFSLVSAEAWMRTKKVHDPIVASEWRDAGFSADDADRYADDHLTPDQARRVRLQRWRNGDN